MYKRYLVTIVALLLVLCAHRAVATLNFVYSYSFQTPSWSIQGLESDGTRVFCLAGGTIYTHDAISGQLLNTFTVPIGTLGLGLAYDGTNLFAVDSSYTGTSSNVVKFDPTNGTVLNSFSVEVGLVSAAFLNNRLYGYGGYTQSIKAIDPSNGQILNSLPLSIWNWMDGLASYGSNLISASDQTLYEIDSSTGSILDTVQLPNPFGQGIRGLAFANNKLFVSGVDFPPGPGRVDVYSVVHEPNDYLIPGKSYMCEGSLSGLRLAYQTFDAGLKDSSCSQCSTNRELKFLHAVTKTAMLFIDINDYSITDSFLELAQMFGAEVVGDFFE